MQDLKPQIFCRQANEVSYNAAISACEKGEQWQQANDCLRLLVRLYDS